MDDKREADIFMSLLKNLNKKMKIRMEKLKNGVFIDIKTLKLKQDVEFILFNLPKDLVKGIELIEDVFEVDAEPHQIIVKSTMNAIDIKREIGRFVFREKRWKEQEQMTKKILSQEKIDMDLLYEIYGTKDNLVVYEQLNADVFAVCYGNAGMNLDQTSHAINGLYIKRITENMLSKQNDLESLVDSLFEQQD